VSAMKKRLIKVIALSMVLAMIFSLGAMAGTKTQTTPFDNSQFFTCGDYSIHYRVFEAQGQPKGRILMLHGFLLSTYSWQNMAAEMTKAGYTCVLADLPDFGYSSRENANTIAIPREDLMVNLMVSIAPLNTWLVAGHSMGGGVAMNIAIEHPEIKGLLLYCPAPNTATSKILNPLITNQIVGSAYSAFFKFSTYPKTLVKLAVAYVAMDFKFGMAYDTAKITDPLNLPGTGLGMTYMTANTRSTDMTALPGLKMPVFLVEGEKDNFLPKTMVSGTIAALPQATLYIVKGGGHICIENKAPEIAAATVAFLNNAF